MQNAERIINASDFFRFGINTVVLPKVQKTIEQDQEVFETTIIAFPADRNEDPVLIEGEEFGTNYNAFYEYANLMSHIGVYSAMVFICENRATEDDGRGTFPVVGAFFIAGPYRMTALIHIDETDPANRKVGKVDFLDPQGDAARAALAQPSSNMVH